MRKKEYTTGSDSFKF